MAKINIPQNIKDLQTARQLIENAYQDLKNVREFREAGMTPGASTESDRLITVDIYSDVMNGLADLIEAAKGAS